jgi:8-amino-7-oxononanoate synthase
VLIDRTSARPTSLANLICRRSQAVPRLIEKLRAYGFVQQHASSLSGGRIRLNGRWVLNFASCNYLGTRKHPSLAPAIVQAIQDKGMSLAMPRQLAVDNLTRQLEQLLAVLTGQESALIFPSTTHIALDVLPLLAGRRGVFLVDERAYPISLEGAYAASRKGARIRRFNHNDPLALAEALVKFEAYPDKVIVCDGIYVSGGSVARLRDFDRLAREFDAVIYVDDAHGFGLLGSWPTRRAPYGCGGGGTPRHRSVPPGNIVHVGSLSKPFSIPVAFVSGPSIFIRYLASTTGAFSHSSQPAVPTLAAALAVLQVHNEQGDYWRQRLLALVVGFRRKLSQASLQLSPQWPLPVQSLPFSTPLAAARFAFALRSRGILSVLQLRPPDRPAGGVVRFIITANHKQADIEQLAANIAAVTQDIGSDSLPYQALRRQ